MSREKFTDGVRPGAAPRDARPAYGGLPATTRGAPAWAGSASKLRAVPGTAKGPPLARGALPEAVRRRRGYFAVRACGCAAAAAAAPFAFAFFFSARSSSQMVIGAAMNQVE